MPERVWLLLAVTMLCCRGASAQEQAWPQTIRLAYEPEELSVSQQHHRAVDTENLLKNLGIAVERYVCPWARCLELARQGKLDFLDHLYRTKDREAYLHYLEPPYQAQTGIFRFYSIEASQAVVNTFEDLKHYRVAAIRGNAYFPKFDTDPTINRIEATSEQQMVQMVVRGRVDMFIAQPSLTSILANELAQGAVLREQPLRIEEIQGVYFAIPKASPWFASRQHLESSIKQALRLEQGIPAH